jgi:3-hydroxyacyl-CoA dehydrogenase/enoyl-CoA hydratase/3-hydroxybutyryl-CoA epimerase
LPAQAIFASNTSTLPISGLAERSSRPAQFIGLHFFSPVERMPLVEIIRGQATSDETLARAMDYVAQLRMTPVVVNDSRGFYTSRVFQTFIHEGMAMLQDGVAPALIENSARMAGMPIGPLALLDEVTIELPWKIVQQSIDDLGDQYVRPCSYDVMQKMVEELKRIGRRAGGGFYDYPEEGGKQLWSGLKDTFPVALEQPSAAELIKRFLYIQALETARCLEEGVLTHPADGDIGSVLAWGYPSWTGGTLSFIDTVGIQTFVIECERLAKHYGDRFKPSAWLRQGALSGEPIYGRIGNEELVGVRSGAL